MKYFWSRTKGRVKRNKYFSPLIRVYAVLFGKQKGPVDSKKYWEKRYREGGNSGLGSYGELSEFKADIINSFVRKHNLYSVIEFGCGDGNQLSLSNYQKYMGFDVSESALLLCKSAFDGDSTKRFSLMSEYKGETADVSLSLDVIYHLVEENIFIDYMKSLFSAANKFVIIYSSDEEHDPGKPVSYVKHRTFTRWVKNNIVGWELQQHVPNPYPYLNENSPGSFADFYIYIKSP